jgi:hypothetical protein
MVGCGADYGCNEDDLHVVLFPVAQAHSDEAWRGLEAADAVLSVATGCPAPAEDGDEG